MEKVLSVRVDQAVLQQLTHAARQAGVSKKRFVEDAILQHARKTQDEDVWASTAGAWDRDETAAESIQASRNAFNRSMQRHQAD